MAEVLVQIDEPQRAADGRAFIAQVHGARTMTGLWEAWIEFTPRDGGDPVRTPRETEQFTRGDLRYWAAGLTRADLATALARALSPEPVPIPRGLIIPTPVTRSEPEEAATALGTSGPLPSPVPPFDPVAVLQQSGEYSLRHELRALDAHELREIIRAFDIPDTDVTDLARTFEDALAERIVATVQQRAEASTGRRKSAHRERSAD